MDRFVWTSGLLEINETLVIQQRGVRIYDGEEKVGPPRAARLGLALPAPGAQSGWPLGPPRRRPRPRGAAPRLGRRPGSQRARTVAAPLRPPPRHPPSGGPPCVDREGHRGTRSRRDCGGPHFGWSQHLRPGSGRNAGAGRPRLCWDAAAVQSPNPEQWVLPAPPGTGRGLAGL